MIQNGTFKAERDILNQHIYFIAFLTSGQKIGLFNYVDDKVMLTHTLPHTYLLLASDICAKIQAYEAEQNITNR